MGKGAGWATQPLPEAAGRPHGLVSRGWACFWRTLFAQNTLSPCLAPLLDNGPAWHRPTGPGASPWHWLCSGRLPPYLFIFFLRTKPLALGYPSGHRALGDGTGTCRIFMICPLSFWHGDTCRNLTRTSPWRLLPSAQDGIVAVSNPEHPPTWHLGEGHISGMG